VGVSEDINEEELMVDLVQAPCHRNSQGFSNGLGSLEYYSELTRALTQGRLTISVDGWKQFLPMVSRTVWVSGDR
jgi:hypothetical protein